MNLELGKTGIARQYMKSVCMRVLTSETCYITGETNASTL
jgi:hypothetical protein